MNIKETIDLIKRVETDLTNHIIKEKLNKEDAKNLYFSVLDCFASEERFEELYKYVEEIFIANAYKIDNPKYLLNGN